MYILFADGGIHIPPHGSLQAVRRVALLCLYFRQSSSSWRRDMVKPIPHFVLLFPN